MSDQSALDGLASLRAGLEAQLSRVERFKDAADPAAALRGSRLVTEFLHPRVPELRAAAALPAGHGSSAHGRELALVEGARAVDVELPVFCYWGTGIDGAPEIVRACVDRLLSLHPDARILDASSVRELIGIPTRVAEVLEEDHPAHFSDFVRVSLLERYGGIWVDATCWVPDRLSPAVAPLLTAGVVYPRWTTGQIGNWFIAAVPDALVIRLQRIALEMWWTSRSDLPDYFLYHRVFEALRSLIPEFRGQWAQVPFLSSAASHLLQLSMMQRWSPGVADAVRGLSVVQKLSHKFDPADVPEGSILDHLLRTHAL